MASPEERSHCRFFKGAVNTPSGPKPAWYIILDASNQAEAERLGVNFSRNCRTRAMLARPATASLRRHVSFESGVVDFSPDRVLVAGSEDHAFPPRQAQPGSVGDANYSPLVRVDGIVYDAPVIAAAVDDADINSRRATRTTSSCMTR